MSDNSENTKDCVNLLKKELSLLDEEEYQKKKQRDEEVRIYELNETLKLGLDQIKLDDNDLYVIDEFSIQYLLPKSFYDELRIPKDYFLRSGLDELNKKNPKMVNDFFRHLSNCELVFEKHVESEHPEDDDEPVEKLLDRFVYGNQEERPQIAAKLEYRFMGQPDLWKIRIIKTILLDETIDRNWWYFFLLNEWWNDSIIPEVEKAWKVFRESDCAKIIIERFPLDYLKSHQKELGKIDYYALCIRLALCDDFFPDKQRLSARQYYSLMALRHIRLEDKEADNFLFGYILKFLRPDYKPSRYSLYGIDTSQCKPSLCVNDMYDEAHQYNVFIQNYTPSLLFLPNMKSCIHTLVGTGNTRTLMKFIVWDKYIRRNIPTFYSEEYYAHIGIGTNRKRIFSEYLDWSWERLMENAIGNFPFKREDITYEFGLPDDAPF